MLSIKTFFISLLLFIALLSAPSVYTFLETDSCLDAGGAWDQDYGFCYFHESGIADLVTVDKSAKTMSITSGGKVIRTFSVVFGAEPEGHKQQEGDEKTPEGTYLLDYKKEDSSFYRSMHINYPNSADKKAAQSLGVSPGGFIMVHGQRNRLGWLAPIMQKFNWTDGCIAITNSEMDEFMHLVPVNTKIVIKP
jgi:murein L,D-transpeptidase YafK